MLAELSSYILFPREINIKVRVVLQESYKIRLNVRSTQMKFAIYLCQGIY